MILIAGIAGAFFILVAFLLDEFYKNYNSETLPYNLLNLVGSALLIYYAYKLQSWPFLVLNVVWFSAAGIKLCKILQKN